MERSGTLGYHSWMIVSPRSGRQRPGNQTSIARFTGSRILPFILPRVPLRSTLGFTLSPAAAGWLNFSIHIYLLIHKPTNASACTRETISLSFTSSLFLVARSKSSTIPSAAFFPNVTR